MTQFYIQSVYFYSQTCHKNYTFFVIVLFQQNILICIPAEKLQTNRLKKLDYKI